MLTLVMRLVSWDCQESTYAETVTGLSSKVTDLTCLKSITRCHIKSTYLPIHSSEYSGDIFCWSGLPGYLPGLSGHSPARRCVWGRQLPSYNSDRCCRELLLYCCSKLIRELGLHHLRNLFICSVMLSHCWYFDVFWFFCKTILAN